MKAKITKTRLQFSQRRNKAEKDLLMFRDKSMKRIEETSKQPEAAEISMELYESLLSVDYGINQKPKLIGELFGIKIYIDPMLKKDEIKWRFNND